jgi:hypothetical protein
MLKKGRNTALKFLESNEVSFSFVSDMAAFLEYTVKHDYNITTGGRIFFPLQEVSV